jgi:hypothetical protein
MFKCLCDTIILDDFKTALDKLSVRWLARNGMNGVHIDLRNHPTFSEERGVQLEEGSDDSPKPQISAVHIA